MALPIRLIVGPTNLFEIPLEAQSLDITLDRNASAFPTPDNILKRFAVDGNIPTIGIEIGGILVDDDVTFESDSKININQGGAIGINFASNMPTKINSTPLLHIDDIVPMSNEYWLRTRLRNDIDDIAITDDKTVVDIKNTPIDAFGDTYDPSITAYIGKHVEDTGADVDHPSSGTYSAGVTSIEVDDASAMFIGQRLTKDDGTYIGTVTNIVSDTITISEGIQVDLADGTDLSYPRSSLWGPTGLVGGIIDGDMDSDAEKIATIELDRVEIPITKEHFYFISAYGVPPLEETFRNTRLRFKPNFWKASKTSSSWIYLNFDPDTPAHSTFQSGPLTGQYPSVTQKSSHEQRFDRNGNLTSCLTGPPVVVNVPIGQITAYAADAYNNSPANALAAIVEYALKLTDSAMFYGALTSSDAGSATTLAGTFDVTRNGPMLLVTQKDLPLNQTTPLSSSLSRVYNNGYLARPITPCNKIKESNRINSYIGGVTQGTELARFEYFMDGTNDHTSGVSNKGKSAGDKVQDLMGIISNANKDRDLIRGIQIPYDSLIQSDAVTPTARNFFLTFGQQSLADKGSVNNTIPASRKMTPATLPSELGGDRPDDAEESWLESIGLGVVDDVVDAVGLLGEFIGSLIVDGFITLYSEPHGNEAGMRIIPEKFHVRYDAGNNYYAFNLRLLASDFVIGV